MLPVLNNTFNEKSIKSTREGLLAKRFLDGRGWKQKNAASTP